MSALSKILSLAISRVALNPAVIGALLWVLTRGPDSIRDRLISKVSALRNPETLRRVTKALGWLLVLGTANTVNRKFNELALNAYRANDERKRWKWNKEIAVVTGGCSGIGLLVVKRLILRGVKVAILDVQQLPPALQGYASVKLFVCDITDPSAVSKTAEKVKAMLGSPSILVNNAGIGQPHAVLKTSPEYLRKIFDVNVLSHWYLVQEFLPDMVAKNKGHVVTVASMASYVTVAGMVDYAATKAAVLAFHEGNYSYDRYHMELTHPLIGIAAEVRLRHKAPNILFTSVHPLWVRTPLLEPFNAGLKAAGSPILEPEQVADAISEQLARCSSGQLYVPGSASQAASIRGWPNWAQEYFRGGPIAKALVNAA